MANSVTVEMPKRKISRSDVIFRVRNGRTLVGTLAISKGSLVWFRPNKGYGLKVNWRDFDQLMRKHASREEKR